LSKTWKCTSKLQAAGFRRSSSRASWGGSSSRN
jgi:hypothetical protein